MRIQCESNAHHKSRSRPHCIVWNRIHTCTVTSSGHTSTQLPWRPRQIFTSASHHIASQVKQTRGTQCAAQRSALTVGSRHERECHALFGPHVQSAIAQSSSIRIETTPGSGLGLIQIESGLGELMRIQCECVQTGFDPVQCALDVQVWTCLSQALLLTSNLIRLLAHS